MLQLFILQRLNSNSSLLLPMVAESNFIVDSILLITTIIILFNNIENDLDGVVSNVYNNADEDEDEEDNYALDFLSLPFVVLTHILISLTNLYDSRLEEDNKTHNILLTIFIYFFSNTAFISSDLLTFYINFESVLIPMFILIGWISLRNRKIKATFYFFYFTYIGSFMLLIAMLFLLKENDIIDIGILVEENNLDYSEEFIIFLLFFVAFAVKIPLYPFHIWLPEAHVEASTSGSVILAGILLKLGGYGLLRFIFPVFNEQINLINIELSKFYFFGYLYTAIISFFQLDLKKIVAYSSISHMSLIMYALFDNIGITGLVGSVLMFVNHGFSSGLSFFLIGFLYERFGTKNLENKGLIFCVMPYFSIFVFLKFLSNIAFPLTGIFISELQILSSFLEYWGILILLLNVFGSFLNLLYSLELSVRVLFSRVSVFNTQVTKNLAIYDLKQNQSLLERRKKKSLEFYQELFLIENSGYWQDLDLIEIIICITLCFFIFFITFFSNYFELIIINNIVI